MALVQEESHHAKGMAYFRRYSAKDPVVQKPF